MAKPPPAPRLRRHWRLGLRGLSALASGSGSLSQSYEAMFALAGPTVQREFERFAEDPVGARILAERPRRDLNALLADRESLTSMPQGSFADAYLRYLGENGMGAANDFLKAANLEENGQRFGWTADQCWFVRRMSNSHDLFHVLSGYDRSIVGEIGINAYTAGQIPLLPLKFLLAYLFLLKPSSPIAWPRFVWRSYQHGRRTPPLACVDFEAMLKRPLPEARRLIGVPDLKEVHPRGLPQRGRALRRLEGNLEGGKSSAS